LYNHPVEAFFLDSVGGLVSSKLARLSQRESCIFFTLATLKTVDDHCGYQLPWDPISWFGRLTGNDIAYHNIHHQTWGLKVIIPRNIQSLIYLKSSRRTILMKTRQTFLYFLRFGTLGSAQSIERIRNLGTRDATFSPSKKTNPKILSKIPQKVQEKSIRHSSQ
jgi:hypothetical protein